MKTTGETQAHESRLDDVRGELRDFLNVYHELRIPANDYFDIGRNRFASPGLLCIASPSRMGNHLLMSALDSHPQLPRVPGEDGFLAFTFARANQDVHALLRALRGKDALEFITTIGSNGGRNKWREFKKAYRNKTRGLSCSGVKVSQYSSPIDFEDTLFDVDYEAYEQHIKEHLDVFRQSTEFNTAFAEYLTALALLDFGRRSEAYPLYLVYGGMRTQVQWLCETFSGVKVLCSLREFPSYAVSQIKARHGDVPLTPELVKTAREHWYHKVIDMLTLKLRYPGHIGLVTVRDMLERPEAARRALCRFLGVDVDPALEQATIFGHPVKGNSWRSRAGESAGLFYQSPERLPPESVPPEFDLIWEQLNKITINATQP